MRFALLLVVVAVGACSTSPRQDPPKQAQQVVAPPSGPQPTVVLSSPKGDATVSVEVVSTEPKIERGLMYRENLPPDAGMLFLMGEERDWAFYMRNTLIPLDMIFIKKDMTVAGIVPNAEPRTETHRQVGVPSMYVLEVNGGWAAAHGVLAGAKVRFEHVGP